MSTSLLLPNPCLLGIVFTIATHDGSKLVFHYPPKPNEFGFQATPLDINDIGSDEDDYRDDQNDSDSDSDSDSYGYNDSFDEDGNESAILGSEFESDDYGLSEFEDELSEFGGSDLDNKSRQSSLDTIDMKNYKKNKNRYLKNRTGINNTNSNSTNNISISNHSGSHHRTSSSSENKYQSGRDLLELLYERERKKKKRKAAKYKKKLKLKKQKEDELKKEKDEHSRNMSSVTNTSMNGLNDNTKSNEPIKEYKIEKLFSFDCDFISDLATPPKSLCNTRFELTVEDMVFLGLPVHINDDGSWRNSKKQRKNRRNTLSTSRKTARKSSINSGFSISNNSNKNNNKNDNNDDVNDGDDIISNDNTNEEMNISNENNGKPPDINLKNDILDADNEERDDGGMYQFNMLFVMNPPVVEYNHRIDEMFHYIISRISLLLRYEQQKSNYVWKESEKILKLKEELIHLPIKQQWSQIINESSLAKIIYDTYNSIIRSDIVNLEINNKLNSFQIPIRKEFMTLPPRYMKLPENSILSSISPFLNNDNSDLMKYFGLLLLDDIESIIKDLRAEKDSVIASFLRLIKPNESLQRLSILSGLDIQEVKLFANHLVYWRRAITILPLTSRNVYIISPISNIGNIYSDKEEFNGVFPNLPQLPTFLSMISEISRIKPRSINNIIPSKDHRGLYLEAIEWLYKKGYITQLYTFVYIKISKEIKIKVAEDIEIEMKKKEEKKKRQMELDEMNDSNIIESIDQERTMELLNSNDNEDVNEGNVIDKIQNDEELRNDDSEVNERVDISTNLDEMSIDIDEADISVRIEEDAIEDLGVKTGENNFRIRNLDNSTDIRGNKYTDNGKSEIRKSSKMADNRDSSQTEIATADADAGQASKADVANEATGSIMANNNSSSSNSNAVNSGTVVQFEEEEEEDTILLEPEYATGLERRWIAALVEKHLEQSVGGLSGVPGNVSGVPAHWPALFYKLLRHFNGKVPLELVSARESVSRIELRRLVERLAESGAVAVVRHW